MFENLDGNVLKEISLIDQDQHIGVFKFVGVNNCLKEAFGVCRRDPDSTELSEMEMQQIERGILAAQRISAKHFEKEGLL